jgi:hypothetical protein
LSCPDGHIVLTVGFAAERIAMQPESPTAQDERERKSPRNILLLRLDVHGSKSEQLSAAFRVRTDGISSWFQALKDSLGEGEWLIRQVAAADAGQVIVHKIFSMT